MKKIFVFLLLFIVGVTLPFGCAANQSNFRRENNSQENVLSVYNFSAYIDPAMIKEFEQKYSAKVKYDTYESMDDLYAKLKPGNPGYDVIFPSDYMVTIMGKENLVEELNLANIPNLKNLDPKFLKAPFDPENKYSLPYQWGTMGFGYNIQKTGGEIDSWAMVFDPKYKAKVALMDELRTMMGAILIYLGYDANTTNPDEINKAKDFLIQHKDNIAAFAPDTGQMLLDQGEVDIAVEWSGDIFQIMEENLNIRYAIPKEGAVIWIDNMSIAKGAPHKELAEKFINFLLEPEVGAKISNFIKYATPNKMALEKGLINKEDLKNPGIYPSAETFDKMTFIKDVGEANQLYDQAWTEIKAEIGG
ncbi:spermidine/putrescine-binding periplasmic protein [Pleurocapsa sp. PCC 7327]|uniref:ABC transporter substrate-binding protein n=1 Tax=Pleurocapsa sp. PCC 7327 TaxID=118163 RepID=UPI00029F978F|nr:spermidine/putrescine ABC transporter substrate-binding protein [Pleurocapsa sp. PCC 7327]AFY76185.1 spermidine/putrescine-binding periplasmic protein [Pleurocapsa sp. PCC 7327]